MYEPTGSQATRTSRAWTDWDPEHPQVLVTLPALVGGGTTWVDVGIVSLLREIWQHGWPTFSSCQDAADGTAQVVFDRGADVIQFLIRAEITERVQVKVLAASTRTGPLIEDPTAVYFDRRLIGHAAERLRFGQGAVHEQYTRLRSRRVGGAR